MTLAAKRPLTLPEAGASQPRLADALSDFAWRVRIPFFDTQMGKGAVSGGSNLNMGTAVLVLACFASLPLERLITTRGRSPNQMQKTMIQLQRALPLIGRIRGTNEYWPICCFRLTISELLIAYAERFLIALAPLAL
jgi:hypothetical protein